MSAWTDPAWLAEARAWIDEQAARLGWSVVGEIEQPHDRPWATVLRVPTERGDLYFKANAPPLQFEAALVEVLAERRPDAVPPLVAVDLERGWLLMEDAGTRLRELVEQERDLDRWLDVLPLYAGLQLDLADARGRPGCARRPRPPPRPSTRAVRAASRTRSSSRPRRPSTGRRERAAGRELCDELAGFGLPETIQHDDFHDGQVYVRDGRYLLLDWGDACVSHPFFTLSVTLEGMLAWGLDDVEGSVDTTPFRNAYLAAFADYGDRSALEAAATIALRLGWVCRAVNARLGNPEGSNTDVHLRMFLDGRT